MTLNRLIPDTVENMFRLDASNTPDCPVYMEINKNTVILTVHIEFIGDYNSEFLGEYENEKNKGKNYAEIIVDSIEEHWTTEFFGNGTIDPVTGEYVVYDFIEGLKGQLITKVVLKDSEEDNNENQQYVVCNFSNDLGVSLVEGKYAHNQWSISKTREMKVFAGDSRTRECSH